MDCMLLPFKGGRISKENNVESAFSRCSVTFMDKINWCKDKLKVEDNAFGVPKSESDFLRLQ
jgi:hypothetical protein